MSLFWLNITFKDLRVWRQKRCRKLQVMLITLNILPGTKDTVLWSSYTGLNYIKLRLHPQTTDCKWLWLTFRHHWLFAFWQVFRIKSQQLEECPESVIHLVLSHLVGWSLGLFFAHLRYFIKYRIIMKSRRILVCILKMMKNSISFYCIYVFIGHLVRCVFFFTKQKWEMFYISTTNKLKFMRFSSRIMFEIDRQQRWNMQFCIVTLSAARNLRGWRISILSTKCCHVKLVCCSRCLLRRHSSIKMWISIPWHRIALG